jgi:hypothetical protein
MKQKHYNILEVFFGTSLGFVFEFYSSKETKFIIEDLATLTSKNVIVTNDYNYSPSYTTSILLKEFEGDKPRYKFLLHKDNYNYTTSILYPLLEWITKNAITDRNTKMQVILSFDNSKLETLNTISNMDINKMVLKLDENYIQMRFPEFKDSPYCMSIKKLIPNSTKLDFNSLIENLNTSFIVPINKFYGIDFSDYTFGDLKFNYIGGKDWCAKPNEIREVLEYLIITTYGVLNEPGYGLYEQSELKRLSDVYQKWFKYYADPVSFIKENQKIKLTVDLKNDIQNIKTYWQNIRGPLFEILMENDLQKAEFNYDSEIGKYQIKNAKLFRTHLNNLELYNCDLHGIFENCYIKQSKINKSTLINSKLSTQNEVTESYLQNTSVKNPNTLDKCFIFNGQEIISGTLKECFVMFATFTKDAKIDESCIIINRMDIASKINMNMNTGLSTHEIRDYRWLKKLMKK